MQASNFGGTFDQLFLWNFFMKFSQKMPLCFFYTMVQKVKNDQKLKSRGPALNKNTRGKGVEVQGKLKSLPAVGRHTVNDSSVDRKKRPAPWSSLVHRVSTNSARLSHLLFYDLSLMCRMRNGLSLILRAWSYIFYQKVSSKSRNLNFCRARPQLCCILLFFNCVPSWWSWSDIFANDIIPWLILPGWLQLSWQYRCLLDIHCCDSVCMSTHTLKTTKWEWQHDGHDTNLTPDYFLVIYMTSSARSVGSPADPSFIGT